VHHRRDGRRLGANKDTMTASSKNLRERRYLIDPYSDWLEKEAVPVVEDFCVDLPQVVTKPWARFDIDGAVVNMKGRGDFISIFLFDLPPGGATSPQRHLYEEVFYVLSGHGSAVVEDADGSRRDFEWGPGSLFALPLNASYRLFNGSGKERARIASTNNFVMMINTFRNESFVFENPARFSEREGQSNYFTGEGELVPNHAGRYMWETNFIPDLRAFELKNQGWRGGSAQMVFLLAEGTMHAHCSEMSAGTYKKAHRHGPDFHVFIVNGRGYSLFWHEGDKDFLRYDWHPGCVFAPTDGIFHQHFAVSSEPVRYMATAFGSGRYPFSSEKRKIKLGLETSVKMGGSQIDYEDQDPRIHQLYLEELKKNGVECQMPQFRDESVVAEVKRRI
jgi:mannose-6-phosphate isomerase-like protein (cupin superfamily)